MADRLDVDLRQLACPGPVLRVKELFEQGRTRLRLFVADELARSNVQRFVVSRGARAVTEASPDGGFVVLVDADPAACPAA
ncbi:MAG: sulfurtransferase-like selenium metabolism protein YedF, partial [Acidobacteria bacterium]